jgi:hypothetical protein
MVPDSWSPRPVRAASRAGVPHSVLRLTGSRRRPVRPFLKMAVRQFCSPWCRLPSSPGRASHPSWRNSDVIAVTHARNWHRQALTDMTCAMRCLDAGPEQAARPRETSARTALDVIGLSCWSVGQGDRLRSGGRCWLRDRRPAGSPGRWPHPLNHETGLIQPQAALTRATAVARVGADRDPR